MKLLVTGSNGLIGGEVVAHFAGAGHEVHGIDNNMRADYFGPSGDTRWNQARLGETHKAFRHHEVDVRDRATLLECVEQLRPDLIVHAAGQPSHDLAASRPFDDFDVNAVGTLNTLEAARRYARDAGFVFISTNKVYGDAPNQILLEELLTRFDYADPAYADGIPEDFRIDQCKHSLFGASKLAADVLVQEYARYFGMQTCCLRCGCVTGPTHTGVELHGFLSYLARTNVEARTYRVYGYKGKQVRDNIHARDVARFVAAFTAHPRPGEVYNIGGGRRNSCSVLEALDAVEAVSGRKSRWEYVDEHREGDQICYISDLTKARSHFPEWDVAVPLAQMLEEIVAGWRERGVSR